MEGRQKLQVRGENGWRTVHVRMDMLFANLTLLRAYGLKVRVC